MDIEDVRMIKSLKNANFPSNWFFSLGLFDFIFFIDFDGYFFIQWFEYSYSNWCIGSLTDDLSN